LSTKNSLKNKNFFSISDNLKKLRKVKDITIEQLAKRINIPYETYKNYEGSNIVPPLDTLIKLASFFEISLDFLILWNKTPYTKNLKFLNNAEIIDKYNINERFKVEGPISSLLEREKEDITIKTDSKPIDITNIFSENIKKLRVNAGLTQKQIADHLNISANQVAFYENNRSVPPAGKLVKLSELFNISIQALATGKKLDYHFKNESFKEAVLKADKLLTLEQHKFLIELMQAIIKNTTSQS
jgi:transcriptional regulator with XRE-family HTH domain